MTRAMSYVRSDLRKPRDILGALDNAYRRERIRIVIIERGVPITEIEQTKPEKYPFKHMRVGDRTLVDWEPDLTRVRCAAAQAGRRLKRKYKTRRVKNGVHVWRTA